MSSFVDRECRIIDVEQDAFINVNVCGRAYKLVSLEGDVEERRRENYQKSALLYRFLCSSHAERLIICDVYCTSTKTYHFDRDATVFDCILHYCRGGSLHCPVNQCDIGFDEELAFWSVDTAQMSSCCTAPFNHATSPVINSAMAGSESPTQVEIAAFETCHWLKDKRWQLWCIMDNPTTSRTAYFFMWFSIVMVVTATVTLILGSMKEFQVKNAETGAMEPNAIFAAIEVICIIWFTIEFIIRFTIYPKRCTFMREPLNIVDFASVAPYYFEIFMMIMFNKVPSVMDKFQGFLLVLRVLRVLRVARIFKLAKYSGGLSSLGSTLKNSINEIGLLLTFMGITIILYSTSIYYLEKDQEYTKFVSIPATFWWCIVTMTTVGYGDMVPETVGGRIVATLTSISGVIVLAFPITLIVNNFNRQYRATEPPAQRMSLAFPSPHLIHANNVTHNNNCTSSNNNITKSDNITPTIRPASRRQLYQQQQQMLLHHLNQQSQKEEPLSVVRMF